MKDPKDMSPREFAEWWCETEIEWRGQKGLTGALVDRDKALLEAAAERALAVVRGGGARDQIRAAILDLSRGYGQGFWGPYG